MIASAVEPIGGRHWWVVACPRACKRGLRGGLVLPFFFSRRFAQTVELVSGPVLAFGMVLGWDKLSVFVRSTHGADSGCECR